MLRFYVHGVWPKKGMPVRFAEGVKVDKATPGCKNAVQSRRISVVAATTSPTKYLAINRGTENELLQPLRFLEIGRNKLRFRETTVVRGRRIAVRATEPHNLHLPYGIDTLESDTIGKKICEEAHRRGAKVVLLPTIPYGTQTNQAKFPFAMNLYPSTVCKIVSDLAESLVLAGICKIMLVEQSWRKRSEWILRESVWPHAGPLVLVQLGTQHL